MKNLDIRLVVSGTNLRYKQIAERMGVSCSHLSRVLSKPLKPEMRQRILAAIQELWDKDK